MREQRSESKTKPTWNYQLNRQLCRFWKRKKSPSSRLKRTSEGN
ncbi:unnamed protein product [Brassica oleracea]